MTFCTAVNCLDGRVQLPLIRHLQETLGVLYVDMITEAGPVRALSAGGDPAVRESILARVEISRAAHGSQEIVVAAHADCAGNPAADEVQKGQLGEAVDFLAENLPSMTVLGLWVDGSWSVEETCRRPSLS